MKLPVVIGTPLLMLGLGIGLEIAVIVSNKNGGMFQPFSTYFLALQLRTGFRVPQSNVFSVFGDVSAQFLAVSEFSV